MPDASTWAAIIAPVTTLLSGLGGYWLAGRNEESRDKRAASREADARRAAMAERMEEQRHTFQRETLLELQDELQRLMRITARVSIQDTKSLKEHGKTFLLPEGLSDEHHQSTIVVQRLRSRVLDPELRTVVSNFVSACSRQSILPIQTKGLSAEEAIGFIDNELARIGTLYETMSERLGEKIRHELDRRFLVT